MVTGQLPTFQTILREYLKTVREQYDVILLDCCPSLGMLTINALSAADEVLIPMQAHYLSLKGMEQLIGAMVKMKYAKTKYKI